MSLRLPGTGLRRERERERESITHLHLSLVRYCCCAISKLEAIEIKAHFKCDVTITFTVVGEAGFSKHPQAKTSKNQMGAKYI